MGIAFGIAVVLCLAVWLVLAIMTAVAKANRGSRRPRAHWVSALAALIGIAYIVAPEYLRYAQEEKGDNEFPIRLLQDVLPALALLVQVLAVYLSWKASRPVSATADAEALPATGPKTVSAEEKRSVADKPAK